MLTFISPTVLSEASRRFRYKAKWRAGAVLTATFLGSLSLRAAQAIPALLPMPARVQVDDGACRFDRNGAVVSDNDGQDTAEYLAAVLRRGTGSAWPVRNVERAGASKSIRFVLDRKAADIGPEGYCLAVTPKGVTIRAFMSAGLFYGAQTFLELAPARVLADRADTASWQVPCVTIEDRPRFKWRGLMLDVSRHFFTVAEVERVLDVMALHKLNVFHWHLVDDGGWRIEIKKYPRLTTVGAWRPGVGFGLPDSATMAYGPDHQYGGYYTQDQIRAVVAYAAARHITVVPEIEMPGHSSAALAAYPEYSCTGGPFALQMSGGVKRGIYCVGKDETLSFVQDILTEVFRLFPGQYIHIGGDEVPTDNWKACPRCQARMKAEGLKSERELESWFIRQVEAFVTAHGKTLIGWSEIREGGLAPRAVVMDWIGGGREAAQLGHDVVMTPQKFYYFDHPQSADQPDDRSSIKHVTTLASVYQFDPVPKGLTPESAAHVLGVEGCVWTEYIANLPRVEYMMLPRLCALAETAWSPESRRDWSDFSQRLAVHVRRFDALGAKYHPLNEH